jgi:hypothetical protein
MPSNWAGYQMKAREWAKLLVGFVALVLVVAGYHLWSRKVIENGLGRFADNLKAAGFRELPTVRASLAAAVSSRDQGEILRAFHGAVYSQNSRMADSIPILKSYLGDPDPFVRLNAAQGLTIMGDASGEETLIALVKESAPLAGIGKDVRVSAAETLAQFRIHAATPAIQGLYARTKNAELLSFLSTLGAESLDEDTYPYVVSPGTLIEYGETRETRFLPQIASTFHNSKKKDLRVSAAWALATMTGDQEAVNYLLNAAQEIASDTVVLDGSDKALDLYTADEQALKCVGTIRNPAAKRVLELALGSHTQIGITIAIINLVLNQGGSDRATQMVVDQLEERGSSKKWLPWDLVFNLAAQMPDNPQVQKAGRDFAKLSQDGSWQLYGVERKGWPIYNWADGYMIEWVGGQEQSDKRAALKPSPGT